MAGDTQSVLIVEDDRIVAKDLQETLVSLGYDPYAIASSAEEALAHASTRCPDVVLMAVRIKGPLDGMDAAAILHGRYGIPVVYLTAHADDPTIERAKKTARYGYLVKPVTPAELRRGIELALHRHETERLGARDALHSRTERSVVADTQRRPEGAAPPRRSTRRSTVLLADDHVVVREGLVALLTEHDFDVVGAVGDGHLLIDAAIRLRPDVIVTDISMPPGLSGLDVLARLKAERVDSKVIVLTMHHDADMAARAMRAGASGFLLKHSAGEELLDAIHQAQQGHVYLTPALTKDVMERLAAPSGPPEPTLSARQLDVLRLILEGRRMKEIGAALQLSPRTVETHKYEMMRLLNVHSTAELVKYALEHRLIVQ